MSSVIKCPKCGEIFQADETYYTKIVKQIRDKEFLKEFLNREEQFEEDKKDLIQLTKLELEKAFNAELNIKEAEIAKLKSEIKFEQGSKRQILMK